MNLRVAFDDIAAMSTKSDEPDVQRRLVGALRTGALIALAAVLREAVTGSRYDYERFEAVVSTVSKTLDEPTALLPPNVLVSEEEIPS